MASARLASWKPDIHRDGMLLIGVLFAILQPVGLTPRPIDAVTYWQAGTSAHLYPEHWGSAGGGHWLFYPPPVAQLSALLQPLGWDLFAGLLTVATFWAMWFCARRWSFPLIGLGLLSIVGWAPGIFGTLIAYLFLGNLQWILAALTIVALRHPAAWGIELVVKVTCAIGWWWHALRGDWRAAALGAASSVIVITVSFLAAPQLWADFLRFALANGDMTNPPQEAFAVPVGLRLVSGAALLIIGARLDWRWIVPFVCGWSLPALWGFGFLPFVVAACRIAVMDRETAARSEPGNTPRLGWGRLVKVASPANVAH